MSSSMSSSEGCTSSSFCPNQFHQCYLLLEISHPTLPHNQLDTNLLVPLAFWSSAWYHCQLLCLLTLLETFQGHPLFKTKVRPSSSDVFMNLHALEHLLSEIWRSRHATFCPLTSTLFRKWFPMCRTCCFKSILLCLASLQAWCNNILMPLCDLLIYDTI